MLPVMRALDARIQDATAPLQGSKLPRLLTEDIGSGGVLFEGESRFYQRTHKGWNSSRGATEASAYSSDGSA